MLDNGLFVEGKPQWWWKYVFPEKTTFWLSVLNAKLAQEQKVADPDPNPWLQELTAEILESLTMLHSSATIREEAVSQRLKEEAVTKIRSALETVK